MKRGILLIAVCTLFLSSVVVPAWAVTFTIRVTTEGGKPIPNARITLTPVKKGPSGMPKACDRTQVVSDEHGLASVKVADGCDRWKVKVEADGFWEEKKVVDLSKTTDLKVALTPQAAEEESQVGMGH